MKIHDLRAYHKDYKLSDLKAGEVYISSRLQKYMIFTDTDQLVCLETGYLTDSSDHEGDEFNHVNAKLEITH